jgi:hypothetical protein
VIWLCGWCPAGRREVREIEPLAELGITHGMCVAHECLYTIELAALRWRRAHQEAA